MEQSIQQKKKRAGNITIAIDNPFYENVRVSSQASANSSSLMMKRMKKRDPPKFAGLAIPPSKSALTRRMKFKEDEKVTDIRKESPLQNKENLKPNESISGIIQTSNYNMKTPNAADHDDTSPERSPFFDAILSGKKMNISNFNFNSRYYE